MAQEVVPPVSTRIDLSVAGAPMTRVPTTLQACCFNYSACFTETRRRRRVIIPRAGRQCASREKEGENERGINSNRRGIRNYYGGMGSRSLARSFFVSA